jgi:hypothetical protein
MDGIFSELLDIGLQESVRIEGFSEAAAAQEGEKDGAGEGKAEDGF